MPLWICMHLSHRFLRRCLAKKVSSLCHLWRLLRLGPTAVDFIGYYATAVDAAIAFALAHRARSEFFSSVAAESSYVAGALAAGDVLLSSALTADDPLATCDAFLDQEALDAFAGDGEPVIRLADAISAPEPLSGGVALTPTLGLGGAIAGHEP